MSNRFPGEIKDPETGKLDYKEIWYKVRSAFAVLLSLAVFIAGGWFIYSKAHDAWMEYRTAEDYVGEGIAPVEVTIPKGAALSDIADILVEADVVKTTKAFTREAAANGNPSIPYGKYNLKTQLPAKVALAMLLDPKNVVHNRMTLREGLRLTDSVKVMAKASGLPEKEFTKALKDWKKLGLPTWAKRGAEGFVFPETYELPDKPSVKSVIKLTTQQFNRVADDLGFQDGAKALGYSPYQVLVAASIVEKETFKADDRPKVARVIYNRLAQGMKLEFDSTVAYAVKKSGVLNLSSKDLAYDSPYNTRLHKGLPPGPISNPGKASMEAALHPADGDWLFFITVNPESGETLFTSDYNEFLQGKQKYLEWCQASDANHKTCYGK